MNLGDVQKLLRADVLTDEFDASVEVARIKASDLMSDVLSCCESGALLVTGLTNAQAVRTAEIVDLCGIVFARGKRPSVATIQMAKESRIPLMATTLTMYEVCGLLYASETDDGKE